MEELNMETERTRLGIEETEKNIGYVFKDKKLIETALTHSSFANENHVVCNERLEFLGDAILGFVVGSYIYNEYPQLPEGKLTKLRASVVCETMLAKKARELKLNASLRLGRGEEHTGGRDRNSIIADAFESVIGAMYLDGGIDEASRFILGQLIPEIKEMQSSVRILDGKTCLQEIIQKNCKTPIEYVIVDESGPAHNKSFRTEVRLGGKVLGSGSGHSKKEAEQNAAIDAINKLK
jgi:ribonuclease-3